jgi:hypothetical protein
MLICVATVALQCCTGASIFDRCLAIFATVVTVVSFLYALWAERNRRTAREAAKLAEERLLTYIAGTDFAVAARMAYELIIVVGARDWNSARKLTAEMANVLAHAKGAWSKKLERAELDAIKDLENQIAEWPSLIPTDDSALNREQVNAVSKGCMLAIQTIKAIAARIGREFLQRNGEE